MPQPEIRSHFINAIRCLEAEARFCRMYGGRGNESARRQAWNAAQSWWRGLRLAHG